MYKGTHDGDIAEIEFVTYFNLHKNEFKDYLSHFSQYNDLWMVRVNTHQMSKLSGKKVFTRSDCYLANISSDITILLQQNNYYLSEETLNTNDIKYEPIPYSGISIKMTTSKSFQILKTGPNSFNALFNSYELGAGASLFCMKEIELEKNIDLIKGWKTSIDCMTSYFDKFTKGNRLFYLDKKICKDIKNYSCSEIKRMINESTNLQKKIFNGIGLYEEPYTALYFYQGSYILPLTMIPFNITTKFMDVLREIIQSS